jgi:hypothetical protein
MRDDLLFALDKDNQEQKRKYKDAKRKLIEYKMNRETRNAKDRSSRERERERDRGRAQSDERGGGGGAYTN